MQEKWQRSCWSSGGTHLQTKIPDKDWIKKECESQKTFIKYWKEINPKNKKQLVQCITRACTFYTYNYVVEPFSTKELRRAYEMYMDQKIVPSKTKLGFFVLGQFNSLSEIIETSKFPKHIKTFNDLTKLNFGPELYTALATFARKIDQYEKYNENWQDYIPLEIALQKRPLVPTNIQSRIYRSWDYKKQVYDSRTHHSYYEQEQPWNFIGLIKRETKHRMDVKWKSSPWHKEIQLEQKLLGN